MALGTFLLVLGNSLLASVEVGMERSITGSIAGHMQVYDKHAKDELALFGGGMMASDDIGQISSFAPVKAALKDLPDVQAVVPMGITMATVALPGELELTLTRMREATHQGDATSRTRLFAQVLQIVAQMKKDTQHTLSLTSDVARVEQDVAIFDHVTAPEFTLFLERTPLEALEYLDTKLAPLAGDGRTAYMRVLGTDLDQFTKEFDRFVLIEGQLVPQGKSGMLLSRRYRDEFLKNPVARDLDKLYDAVVVQGHRLAYDAKLRDQARRLPAQYARITYDVSAEAAAKLEAALKAELKLPDANLADLMKAFLTIDDNNLAARHAFFEAQIVPNIREYTAEIGKPLTLRSFTKSGYLKAVNVPIYGVFDFKGLESSDLAGGQNLIDLPTFRELFGAMSEAQRAELAAVKARVATRDVGRDDAEAALFGDAADIQGVQAQAAVGFDEFSGEALGDIKKAAEAATADRRFTAVDIDNGLVLTAAVVLKSRDRLVPALQAVQGALDQAKLELKVVDWQKAAGLVGQVIWVIRGILYVAIGIIFLVALFIIHNSMVIATIDRTSELGTMRAIGAQRLFVVTMFIAETLVLGLIAGIVGSALAGLFVGYLGQVGLSAGGVDVLVFVFSGPRLYPSVSLMHQLAGVATIVVVSLIATFYPALLANSVPPVVAMQAKE